MLNVVACGAFRDRRLVEVLKMSWNPHMEVQYINSSYPYNSAGSFMEYFEGLTYQHVNFIFDGASHVQVQFLFQKLLLLLH